jgi:hypothetical protein
MLTKNYIEVLLVDEKLADQVSKAWDKGEVDDAIACTAWMIIARKNAVRRPERTMNRGRLP